MVPRDWRSGNGGRRDMRAWRWARRSCRPSPGASDSGAVTSTGITSARFINRRTEIKPFVRRPRCPLSVGSHDRRDIARRGSHRRCGTGGGRHSAAPCCWRGSARRWPRPQASNLRSTTRSSPHRRRPYARAARERQGSDTCLTPPPAAAGVGHPSDPHRRASQAVARISHQSKIKLSEAAARTRPSRSPIARSRPPAFASGPCSCRGR